MADERIDIEIVDKVAKTIKPELLGISAAAKNAYMQIAKLKKELGVTASSSVARAAREVAAAEKQATQASQARERQARATAAALDKEAASASRLAAVAARAARTGVAQGSGSNLGGMAGSRSTVAAQTNIMRNGFDRVRDSAKKTGEAVEDVDKKINSVGKQSQLARHHLLNLGFQLQDIFVSLASGQKPLTVFVQQGGQIGQIAAQSGVGLTGMARAAGSVLARFIPLGIAVGTVLGGFALFNREINKDAGIKKYAESLGLTAKEMKELKDVNVTAGDTIKAVFQVIGNAIWQQIGGGVSKAWKTMKQWFEEVKAAAKSELNFIIGANVGGFNAIVKVWKMLPAAIGDIFIQAVNKAIGAINFLIKKAIDGINWISKQANSILPEALQIPMLDDAQINAVKNQWAGAANKVGTAWRDEMDKAMSVDYVGAAYNAVLDQATKNVQERIRKQADAIKEGRAGGRHGKSDAERLAERQAEAIRRINEELQRESALLAQRLVGIDATVAERMSSIEESLNNVKMSLKDASGNWTEYGRSVLEAVTANETAKKSLEDLQSAYSFLYSEVIQPTDDWIAAQEAAAFAMTKFGDAAEQAGIERWLALQREAWLDATNPMRQYNMEIADQQQLLKYYGRELEIQTEIQRRYNEQRKLMPNIEPDRSAIGGDVRSDMRRQGVQGFLGDVDRAANDPYREGGNQWLIDNYDSLYAEIQKRRDADLAHATEYNRQLAELDRRYIDARLSGTESMFGQLATLQSSSVREIAAIGKAAAIAQATIDGIRAVQAALAGPPGPPWSYGIAAATGVATAANVAKIAGIGFQKGGYTGDVPTHQVAGAVHGREFVMDAAATARIGVPALEAMRNGRLNPGPAANNNSAKVTVINNAGADVQVRERSDGELEIIVDRALARKMGPMFERRLSDPNSRESRAIGTNYKTRRNR